MAEIYDPYEDSQVRHILKRVAEVLDLNLEIEGFKAGSTRPYYQVYTKRNGIHHIIVTARSYKELKRFLRGLWDICELVQLNKEQKALAQLS
mgnify:CR=1 FL=1